MLNRASLKDCAALVAGIGMVMLGRLAFRGRLVKRPDGWRRGAGLALRSPAATFVLSSFGLDVWSNKGRPLSPTAAETQLHLAQRINDFLAREPASHINIRRGSVEDHPEPCSGPSYTLGFGPPIEGPARFLLPDDWSGKDCRSIPNDRTTDALLNVVCRVDQTGNTDIWMRINHIGADGVPMQEMMSRMETSWGLSQEVFYPTPQAFFPFCVPRRCAGREDVAEVQAFLDFAPLLAWRKRENAHLPEPMTISAAMLWCLARHPATSGLYMGTTIEVPAKNGLDRAVGVVVVRPEDYFHRREGLRRFVRDFNRQVTDTRNRSSSASRTLDAAALIPAPFAKALLHHGLRQGTSAFGSMGLTILKDARVFGAPIGDVGHADGFLAIGSVDLPTAEGGRVGCVTIKGPEARIVDYPKILEQAIRRAMR